MWCCGAHDQGRYFKYRGVMGPGIQLLTGEGNEHIVKERCADNIGWEKGKVLEEM